MAELAPPSLDVEYATVIIEMLLYGGYTTLFYKCIQILISRRLQADSRFNKKMFACLCFTLIVLYLIASMNLAMTIFCNYQETILVPIKYAQITELQLEHPSTNISISQLEKYTCYVQYNRVTSAKGAIFVIAILISDLFLVFRSYVVWSRRLRMAILPAVAFLADTAIGILYIFDSKEIFDVYHDIFSSDIINTDQVDSLSNILNRTYNISRIGLFSVTLVLNIFCTFLIGFQIWRTQKQAFKNSRQVGYLRYTLVTIIESGVIYSSWIAILLATYTDSSVFNATAHGSAGTYGVYHLFQDATVQIIAITFSIIILRIGQGVSTGDGKSQNGSHSQSLSHMRFRSQTQSSSPGAASTSDREFRVQVSFDRRIWRDDSIELEGSTNASGEASAISVQGLEDSVKLRPEESV